MDIEQVKRTVEIVNSMLNEELYHSGFNTIAKSYYVDRVCNANMSIEEKFQMLTSIMLSDFKGCLAEEEYGLMDDIQKSYKGLYDRIYSRSRKVSRKLKIYFSNDYWDKQVQLMLDNNNKD